MLSLSWFCCDVVSVCYLLTFIQSGSTSAIIEACDWSSGNGKLKGYIPGTPTTVSVTNGSGECRDVCMNQSAFICAAVNYNGRTCELLVENNQTASVVEPVDGSWQYFIRPLCAGIWLPWKATKGVRINGTAFIDSNETALQNCMAKCLGFVNGAECRAINMRIIIKDKNCKLRDGRVGDKNVVMKENPNWQYFNRPSWYLDSSPGGTQAEIKDLGNIGYYMYIFTEVKLPVSGYLVGWQYYMTATNSCTSYAAIWREVDTYTYKLISKTLLSSEQPTEPGVRFQFVQNEVIRVKQGDVLAVHTAKGDEDDCQKNLVSGRTFDGGETLVNDSAKRVNINDTMMFSKSMEMSLALRAYVSEYQTLTEAPITVANSSTLSSEIWLRLPSLSTAEETATIVGYRIICSTDVNLTQSIFCYNDSLVPTSRRYVLLSLPDVPGTYHIAVQMVRNFNGQLLFEDKYSVTSFYKNSVNGHMKLIITISSATTGGCLLISGLLLTIWWIRKRRKQSTEERPTQNTVSERDNTLEFSEQITTAFDSGDGVIQDSVGRVSMYEDVDNPPKPQSYNDEEDICNGAEVYQETGQGSDHLYGNQTPHQQVYDNQAFAIDQRVYYDLVAPTELPPRTNIKMKNHQ